MLLEGTGFAHGFFVGVLNENGGGPQGRLVSLVVGWREAQQPPIVRRPSRIVVELEVDLPEATIVTDGRKVLSVGGGGAESVDRAASSWPKISIAPTGPLRRSRRSRRSALASEGSLHGGKRGFHLFLIRIIQRVAAEP